MFKLLPYICEMQRLFDQKKYFIIASACFFLLIFIFHINGNEILAAYRLKIIYKFYKVLNKLESSNEFKYSATEFVQDSSISKPVMAKESVYFPDQLLVAEKNGIIKKIDPVHHTHEIVLDISRKNSEEQLIEFYGFEFHPKDSVLAIAYTSFNKRKKQTQNIELIPFNGKKLKYTFRKKVYQIPYSNAHFGGALLFDSLGHLFISTADYTYGDGENYCQSLENLYGKVLRIKIDALTVTIPEDNPFYNLKNACREIWAYGFRNPFRMTFTENSQRIILGDVGHNKIEEINIVEAGKNYGWSIKEGTSFFKELSINKKFINAVYEYKHGTDGFSVTGGIVYKGDKFPELKNKYIFGDYILGNIWALNLAEKKPKPSLLLTNACGVTSFYETKNGDIIWTDLVKSKIYKLINLNESLPIR